MDSIKKAVTALYGTRTEIVEKTFFRCKKNQVTRLTVENEHGNSTIVAKYFVWGSALKEEKILNLCQSSRISAPRVLLRTGKVLLMEYIEGTSPSLGELQNPEYLSRLVVWLASFHKAFRHKTFTRLKGDLRLHNFILTEKDLYGIDFEEASWGIADIDIADICVTLLETGKGFQEENLAIIRRFLEEYSTLQPLTHELSRLICLKLKERSRYRAELQNVYHFWASIVKEYGLETFWAHSSGRAAGEEKNKSKQAVIFQNFSMN